MPEAEPTKLILVNGIPGTGKTTLTQRLAKDLKLPAIGKDQLKEFLADTMRVEGAGWSQLLGVVSAEALSTMVEQLLVHRKTAILESAFHTGFIRPVLQALLTRYSADILELYCTTDATVRDVRFAQRQAKDRHRIHTNDSAMKVTSEAALRERYAPIGVGRVITVDTTSLETHNYEQLIKTVQSWFGERHA